MKEIRLNRTPYYAGDGVEVRIFDKETRKAVKNVEMQIVDVGMEIPVAMYILPDVAQSLMDQLWSCGFRPAEGTGSAGAFAAVQNHLSDMKEIAFHALKIQRKIGQQK